MNEAHATDDEIDMKVSQMVATQRLSKTAPKTVPCPRCSRLFVNEFSRDEHQKALGHT